MYLSEHYHSWFQLCLADRCSGVVLALTLLLMVVRFSAYGFTKFQARRAWLGLSVLPLVAGLAGTAWQLFELRYTLIYQGWSSPIDPLDVAFGSVVCTETGLLCSGLLFVAFLVTHVLELRSAHGAPNNALEATPPNGGVPQL